MRLPITLIAIALLAACGEKSSQPPSSSTPGNIVQASCEPLRYFAQRIAGDHLQVGCPMPPDADPHTWQPDRSAIQKFQSADLILINGAGFESWLTTTSLPEERVVNTGRRLEPDLITYETPSTHRHGSDGEEHTHTGIDSHTWIDPINAKVQAAAIRQALENKWPAHAAEFEKNLQDLIADFDQLDQELRELKPNAPLLAAHPNYNYLARRYAWKITNLTLDPESIPAKDAIPAGASGGVILWESTPREKVAALLEKQHQLKSIVFSTTNGDYFAMMRKNIAELSAAAQ